MRKIKIAEHISLDGVIEHDGDYAYGAWTTPYRTPAGAAMLFEAYGTSFDLLLGRRTYDAWSGFWPNAGNFPMANGINAATKFCVTRGGTGRRGCADRVPGVTGPGQTHPFRYR